LKLFWKNKPPKIKIAVVGNCQARPISKIITTLCSKIEITTVGIVHLLKNEEKAIYDQAFRTSDFIFAQRVANNYPCTFVRTEALKDEYGNKVIVWPNIYYRGYNPELIYLRISNLNPFRGPMGDYHIRSFLDGWKNGLSIEDTISLHNNIDYNRENYGNIPEASLTELREREEDCDIKISKYIEERIWKHRLFFTFNHPTIELLLQAGNALINYAGIHSERVNYTDNWEPLGQFQLPLNPWVENEYGLDFDEVNVWKGIKVIGIDRYHVTTGKTHQFHDKEIVDIFFQIYSANKDMLHDFLSAHNSGASRK
jgi:hypothetical protein